ncbi:tripartite tricarboxylate transporter substrate binding protein [Muricoccus radiodurans]|uniref:tripartite tricarboxylate transporter substrate binding protein n=1 Tax=Muricoccus radiodurans TaxID=2231721 RepID=UPI003CECAF25
MTRATRRAILAATLAAPALRARAQGGPAGDWPNRPIRLVIPWPPGGGADTVGRILAPRVSAILGQTLVIENRPGAAGSIGASSAARSAPDGYTVLYDSTGQAINPYLMQLPFDLWRDLRPVVQTASVPNLLVVTPSMPYRTVADVIAAAKARPGGLDFASSGNGSVQHMALELFRQAAGIPVNHVPYRGGGPALTDVISGQINHFFSNASSSTGFVRAGTIRAIAHTGTGRLAAFPDLPSVGETLPGYEATEWNGVFVPAGTPDAIVARLNAAYNDAMEAPEIAERLAGLNVVTRRNTPEEFAAFIRAEQARWSRVIREGHIRIE